MRELALILLIFEMAIPAHAARQIRVEQLQEVLASTRGKADSKVAQLLSGFQLVERLNAETLSRWQAGMPGPESRRSLVLLADLSAFLNPPASEIPATATPDSATQRELIASVVDYAKRTTHQLPNFLATRDTIRFEDEPPSQRSDSSFIPYKPLHAVQRLTATVVYRDGQEVDSGTTQANQSPVSRGLITSGEFGPVIGTVLVDAARGKLTWSHWEKGVRGPVAVFRYLVPSEESHYEVKFCCVSGESINGVVARKTGYHGEMAIDPATGSIMRLLLKADLGKEDKIVRADMLVEYGPVDIGGQTYICPIKSVSIFVAPAAPAQKLDLRHNPFAEEALKNDRSPGLQTKLNDVVFDQYHVFRSEARVLTGDSVPPATDPVADRKSIAPGMSSGAVALPLESAKPPAAPAQDTAVDRAIGVPPAPGTAPTESKPAAATPEIAIEQSPKIPELSTIPANADKDFTLRVTTRLVDVGVVALDKKGRPVRNLEPTDFEIFDDGRRQTVRSFSGPGTPSDVPVATPANQPLNAPVETVYSNRRRNADDATSRGPKPDSGVTILLLDAASLSIADLARARERVLGGLQALSAGERVGLYVRGSGGYQVLMEATTDHERLVSLLRSWRPSAADLDRAQEAERRNRQQFDEVQHEEDLQSTNGSIATVPDSATTVDPVLRDFGRNPTANALATLVGVARHLAATPGRKNLVWIASENVLADWTDMAVRSDKGGNHLDDAIVRAQEALNDAHVSLYPLDASRLESQAIDPSLANQSVDMSSDVAGPPGPQGGRKEGRVSAEMHQDAFAIQSSIQEMAQATGGRVFRRGGDLAADLSAVVEDESASYILSFAPDTPADNRYHALTIKVASHHGIVLHYRAGYLYTTEPATPKDRFREAVWRSFDSSDIALSAQALPAYTGSAFKLNIAINDLALELKGGRWVDKLDIFLVRRGADGSRAEVTARSLVLALLPSTYQSLLKDGIPFEEFVEKDNTTASLRFLVVDVNSGRMGSLTMPSVSAQ